MAITENDFNFLKKLVYDQSAIVLETGKEYLVESRLQPLAQKEGLKSIEELVQQIRLNKFGNGINKKIVEAMTTNETSFFRDVHPFETLKKEILPPLIEKRKIRQELNLWCGASSSGQEPYSIAMILRENFPQISKWKINFYASDISQQMLDRCRKGLYTQMEVNRGLPATMLVKYFQRQGPDWQIKDELRRTILFREINLCGPWPYLPKMDVVFLRNVLIYFDVETKKTILNKINRLLSPDGALFMGAAESTLNLNENFARTPYKQSGCYQIASPT